MLSPLATAHVQSPRNAGSLENATHYGQAGIPGEGPYCQVWLKVESNTIRQATYQCNGCPSQIASASLMVDLMRGRTLEQAFTLEVSDLIRILGGLPEGKGDCAHRAVQALQSALQSTENSTQP